MSEYVILPTSSILIDTVISKSFKYALFFQVEFTLNVSNCSAFDFITEDFFLTYSDDILCYRASRNKNISSARVKIQKSGFYFSYFAIKFDRENKKIIFAVEGLMNLDITVDSIFKSILQSLKCVGFKPLKDFSYSKKIVNYAESNKIKYMHIELTRFHIFAISNKVEKIHSKLFVLNEAS